MSEKADEGLSRKDKILIHEYQEATQQCRNHDDLVRKGISIFAALQAAIFGFLVKTDKTDPVELVLSLKILGAWLSVVVLLTTLRLHHRYKNYMKRAKCIENELGMYLYQYSSDYFDTENIPGQLLGNKILLACIPFGTFWIYIYMFWIMPNAFGKYIAILFIIAAVIFYFVSKETLSWLCDKICAIICRKRPA